MTSDCPGVRNVRKSAHSAQSMQSTQSTGGQRRTEMSIVSRAYARHTDAATLASVD